MGTEVEEVIDLYLDKIENYDYLDYSEDELLEELKPMLNSAISKLFTLDLSIDWDLGVFNRELSPIEQNIVAFGLVEEFISQKVNSIKVLENHLAMKDYNLYSSANMLKQLQVALKSAQSEVQYWETRLAWRKKAKDIKDGD